MIQIAQLFLRPLEMRPARLRKILACTIDIEIEHRHRRTKRIALAPSALFGGALQRSCDAAWIRPREDPRLQIQGVTFFGNTPRPPFNVLPGHVRSFLSMLLSESVAHHPWGPPSFWRRTFCLS